MIIGVIILLLIVVSIMWILFAPVNIRINTADGLYQIKQTGTITASLHPGETPIFRFRIFGFHVDLARKDDHGESAQASKKTTRRIATKSKSATAWVALFIRISRSFQCKRFICNIDFDDVVLNAQLFPLGYLLSRGTVRLNINFEGNYLLDIWIQARVHRMVWAFIRFYLTK